MSARPGELATTPTDTPADPASQDNSTSGATASFLAELRGSGAENSPGASPEKKSKFSGPTLLVLGVAGAGVLLLLGMRKFATGGAADFNPIKIEYTRDAAAVARANAQRSVLDALERSGSPVQVPTDQIKKNPFELASKPKVATDATPAGPSSDQIQARTAAERAKKVADALAALKLNSVMDGPTPLARINGETVRAGDTLTDGLFTVKHISGRTVVLESDGKEYQLQMEASKLPGAGPRRGK